MAVLAPEPKPDFGAIRQLEFRRMATLNATKVAGECVAAMIKAGQPTVDGASIPSLVADIANDIYKTVYAKLAEEKV